MEALLMGIAGASSTFFCFRAGAELAAFAKPA